MKLSLVVDSSWSICRGSVAGAIHGLDVLEKVQRGLIPGFVDALLTTNASSRMRNANAGPCYLQILEDAKIISKCTRFDTKSRKSLAGEQKYYLADLSFNFALNTDNRINYGPVLENIVSRYARSLGYEVSVGRIGKLECDFIMRGRDMGYSYVQVAMTIMGSEKTENREYRPWDTARLAAHKCGMAAVFNKQPR